MMPSCLSILFRALRIEWRETKHTLFPTTPIETGLFLFFFLLYGCIGYRLISTRAEEHSTSAIPFSASSIC